MTLKAQYSYDWKSVQRKCTLHLFCFELSHNRDTAMVVLIELSYINTGRLMNIVVQKCVIN
jgi:hypothetical protein